MLSDRSRQALLDIRDNIILAREFTAGLTVERFTQDQRTLCSDPLPRDYFGSEPAARR
jgi:hypothetical protein